MNTKPFLFLLALSFTLLTACGIRQPIESDADLSAFYNGVLEDYESPEWMSLEPEAIEMLYPGLLDLDLEQCLVSTAAISSIAWEMALAESKNADGAQAIQDVFQARIDYQVGDGNGPGGAFYPETTRQWEENSRIAVNGNYVMLVVSENADAIVEDFNHLFD